MPTTPPGLTAPPTAPSRADSANFATRGDAFLAWFATLYTEMTAAVANVYANALDAFTNANSAAASASASAASKVAAQAAALDAAAAANAPAWVSGSTYALGAAVWSPVTGYIYRRIVAGAGTTDPSADATNWAASSSANLAHINLTTAMGIT